MGPSPRWLCGVFFFFSLSFADRFLATLIFQSFRPCAFGQLLRER